MTNQQQTHSIMLRVRKIIYEDAYVSVPVTTKIMKQQEDGTYNLDSDAFMAEAVRLAGEPNLQWATEQTTIEPHPIQQPLPEGREAVTPTQE